MSDNKNKHQTMNDIPSNPSLTKPPSPPPPRSMEEIKAEARAFALSTTTTTTTSTNPNKLNHYQQQHNVKKRHQLLLSSVLMKHTTTGSSISTATAVSLPIHSNVTKKTATTKSKEMMTATTTTTAAPNTTTNSKKRDASSISSETSNDPSDDILLPHRSSRHSRVSNINTTTTTTVPTIPTTSTSGRQTNIQSSDPPPIHNNTNTNNSNSNNSSRITIPPPLQDDEHDLNDNDQNDDDEPDHENNNTNDDDEYAQFVKILSTLDDQDKLQALVDGDDDEEEFLLEFDDDDDDDDDEEDEDDNMDGAEDDDNDMDDEHDGEKHQPLHENIPNDRMNPQETTYPMVHDNNNGMMENSMDTTSGQNSNMTAMGVGWPIQDVTDSFYRELEEELGWLEEEDIEAAVATLLDYPVTSLSTGANGQKNTTTNNQENSSFPAETNGRDRSESEEPMNDGENDPDESMSYNKSRSKAMQGDDDDGDDNNNDEPMDNTQQQQDFQYQHKQDNNIVVDNDNDADTTDPMNSNLTAMATSPYRSNSTNYHHHRTVMTPDQEEQLRTLLQKHHQLLLQQAVLAVRAANAQRRHRYATTATMTNNYNTHHLSSSTATTTPNGKDGHGTEWGMSPTSIHTTGTNSQQSPYSEFAHCNETADDIAEILDSAVGMLLDLDENRKDAIRYQIQCESSSTFQDTTSMDHNQKYPHISAASCPNESLSPQRSLYAEFFQERPPSTSSTMMMVTKTAATAVTGSRSSTSRRLTRAQFSKKLMEQSLSYENVKTVFNIRGLHKLMPTFNLLDRCVEGVQKGDNNILEIETNKSACEQVLHFSEASIDPNLIPGCRDLSENFVHAKEIFDDDFTPPCTATQESILRKNRNFFTAGEDNLVLRGVNLYGEKQWVLIADRFLPERSINIISQRYAKLSYMLFQANGIKIDKNGNLPNPPKLESVDDLDEEQLASLQKVQPPAILNVHRWSMEEDLTLLKAVAMMGSMWAEVRARYIPHRDRGHLRKRYQVLERRIKATAGRVKKHEKLMITKLRSPIATQPATSQFVMHANATTQFTAYHSDPVVTNTGTASLRSSTTTKNNSTSQSVTTVKKSNQSLQARSDKQLDPKQQKPPVTKNSIQKEDGQQPPIPPYPIPPPYYHPPHPYMYHPPPPGSYIPYMPPPYGYYPPYYHPGQGYYDDGSRAGYEQLIADPSRGWSQMPHMKSMLESETEVASTIVTQLAKSPSKPPEVQGTAKDAELDKSSDAVKANTMMTSTKGMKSPAQRILKFKGEKSETESASHHSPGRPYPFYGSPAMPMPDPSPGIRPSLFSPDGGFKMDDTRLGAYLQDSPTFPYSHLENSKNSHSLNGYDLNGAFHSTDSGIREVASDTPSNLFNETPDNSRLVDDGTHLLDTDLEAVSALNLLKSPTKNIVNKQGAPERVGITTKKSLFATVVGNLDENKAKTKQKGKKITK